MVLVLYMRTYYYMYIGTCVVHAYVLLHVYKVYLCSSFWCVYEYASLSGGYGMIVLTLQRKYHDYVIFLNIHIHYTCMKDIWYVH